MAKRFKLQLFLYGPQADKKTLGAYTHGEAPDQFAQPSVGTRSSLLVLYCVDEQRRS